MAEQGRVEQAMSALRADHARLGRMIASDSLVSLRPRDFTRGETFFETPPARVDTALDFPGDRQSRAVAALVAASGPRQTYAVAGTPIRIATDIKPSALPTLGPLLRPASPQRRVIGGETCFAVGKDKNDQGAATWTSGYRTPSSIAMTSTSQPPLKPRAATGRSPGCAPWRSG
jgi:hypothetical protein